MKVNRGFYHNMATIFKNSLINQVKGAVVGAVAPAIGEGLINSLNGVGQKLLGKAANVTNPVSPGVSRVLQQQGNMKGTNPDAVEGANPTGSLILGANSSGNPTGKDWRVRVSLSEKANFFYNANPGVMAPLVADQSVPGVIFPYNPTISVSHVARYGNQSYTHSNYPAYFYEGSEVSEIAVDGEFTCQTQEEAKYLLAAVYFFRACTKMWFGKSPRAGTPPPIVFLDGYGEHYFPHVPCVVKQFSHTLPTEVDYIATDNAGGTRMPTMSNVQLTLQPVYSRRRLHESFNLDDFAQGTLIDKGFI